MKAKITVLGLLAGTTAVVLPTTHQAAAETVMIQQADPNDTARTRNRNGVIVLRATDEEHTNEQPSFAFDPNNSSTGIVVMMSTGQLASEAGPNAGDQIQVGNIQGACMPISLVADEAGPTGVTLQPKVAEFKYISQRNSDDNRAYHHPEVEAIGNNRFVITANWDRNNNTNTDRYLQVVDENCNLQQLTGAGPGVQIRENNTSIRIMAKNNDNCSGRQAGGGGDVYVDANGMAHMVSAELCNGNGRDDGWQNYLTVQCAGNTCDVQKISDTSFITREERSRGSCQNMDMIGNDGVPETSFCCGTEGNSQPQREGVWCAAIDNASGELLYRERIAYRGETAEGLRTYAMRIKMLAERNIDGSKTGNVLLQYQMHRGNNNMNDKGGYDDQMLLAMATPTRQGTNVNVVHDLTAAVINSRVEMTHATLFQTYSGSVEAPVNTINLLAGNHNGSSVNAKALQIGIDGAQAFNAGVLNLGTPFDGQKYSKYNGNNPNNQGRNYNDCHVVKNPFADQPGKSQGIPLLNVCAVNGKMSSTAANPEIKPDLVMEVWSSLEAAAQPSPEPPGAELPTAPTPEGNNGASDPVTGTPGTGNQPGQTVGGCSVGNGSTGGSAAFVLFGLALALRRRRRS